MCMWIICINVCSYICDNTLMLVSVCVCVCAHPLESYRFNIPTGSVVPPQ